MGTASQNYKATDENVTSRLSNKPNGQFQSRNMTLSNAISRSLLSVVFQLWQTVLMKDKTAFLYSLFLIYTGHKGALWVDIYSYILIPSVPATIAVFRSAQNVQLKKSVIYSFLYGDIVVNCSHARVF